MTATTTLQPAELPEPQIQHYLRWLRATSGLQFDNYDALWQWSVDDLRGFWRSIWDYFGLQSPTPFASVLDEEKMPGARWFPGAQVNYAQQVFRHVAPAHAAGALHDPAARLDCLAQALHAAWPRPATRCSGPGRRPPAAGSTCRWGRGRCTTWG